MNAALQQICCCRWDHSAGVRITADPQCAVHGGEADYQVRRRLEGEIGAMCESLRDQRTEALRELRKYNRDKRALLAKRRQLEAM